MEHYDLVHILTDFVCNFNTLDGKILPFTVQELVAWISLPKRNVNLVVKLHCVPTLNCRSNHRHSPPLSKDDGSR